MKRMKVHFDLGNNHGIDNKYYENYISNLDDIVFSYTSLRKKQKIALQRTLDNIASFLNELILVVPTKLYNFKKNIEEKGREKIVDFKIYDLYIVIIVASFNFQKGIYKYDSNGFGRCTFQDENGKPIAGFILLQSKKIPDEPQDFYTKDDREFFEIIFHEICHILGFSKNLIQYWRNPNTFQKYGSNNSKIIIKNCKNKYDKNKIHHILRTPRVLSYLRKRYDINNDDECDIGAELEDNFGNIGSHLEGRTYFSEIMSGASVGYNRISNVTLNILEDTGFYRIKKILAEPLEYGDKKSLPHMELSEFLFGPPELFFPQHYFVDYKNNYLIDSYESCSFDHRAIVGLVHKTRNCVENDKSPECKYPNFYDYYNKNKYGDEKFDFTRIGTVKHVCHKSKNNFEKDNKYGSYFGPGSKCALSTLSEYGEASNYVGCFKMKCNKMYELTIYVNDQSGVCVCKGEKLMFQDYNGYIICPDPFIVCGIDNYPNDEFDNNLKNRCKVNSQLFIYKEYRVISSNHNSYIASNCITKQEEIETILEYNQNQLKFEIFSNEPVVFPIKKLLMKNVTIIGRNKSPSIIILKGSKNKYTIGGKNRYHKFSHVCIVNSNSEIITFDTLELRNVDIKSKIKFSCENIFDTDIISFKNFKRQIEDCSSITISGKISEIQEIHFYKDGIIAIEGCCNIRASDDNLDISNDVYIDQTMISTPNLFISVDFKDSNVNKLGLLVHPETTFIRQITLNLHGNLTKVIHFYGNWKIKKTNNLLIINNKESDFITYGREIPAFQIANKIRDPYKSTKFIIIIIFGFIGNIIFVICLFKLFTKFGCR